ncbi:DUF11 domain-containing protein [Vibrio paucivorans]|uniref:DUF11 domain-containing protein n=1 Tax=Vibrio paucivorans TaxID=2829489 RepID=A0A9X3CDX5_9VIBR|nr:DUF11 domain-containing protein [Vibrio paucivorans]MCW8334037.1 DUF11 domain-containing protein [Vibrio paucivorans]
MSFYKCLARVSYLLVCVVALISFQAQAAGEIEVTVSPSSAVYENSEYINYQIEVKNTTAKPLKNVRIEDLFWDAASTGGRAFDSASVTATHSWGSSEGTFMGSDANLEVADATLFAFGKVTYSISALVSDSVVGDIQLGSTTVEADINGDGSSESFTPSSGSVFKPVAYQYEMELTADKSEYAVGGRLTYTLQVTNTGRYDVRGLDISLPLDSLNVASNDGSTISPFQAINISGKKSGSSSDLGSYNSSGDLNVTDARIASGGSLTYSIDTTIADTLVGDIEVMADSSTKDGNVATTPVVTPPSEPKVEIEHSLDKTNPYLVSTKRNYTVEVSNQGGGIAHDYHVKQNIADLVSKLGLANNLSSEHNHSDIDGNPYRSWTVEVSDIGDKSLSNYRSSGIQSNIPIDDTVSIYPGESITYLIKAELSPVAIGPVLGANAAVYDASGNLVKDSQIGSVIEAERVLDVNDSEINIQKTTKASEYLPGGQVEYEIKVTNSSSKYFANDLAVVDDLTCVQTEQAGGAGTGSAFKRWKIEPSSSEDDKGTDPGSYSYGNWITSPVTLSPDIAPGETVTYTLTAEVNDSSVGLIIDDNPACSDNVSEEGSGIQMPEDNLRASKDVDSRYYSAGDILTYTIRVDNDGDGFADQVPVTDDLAAVQTVNVYGEVKPAFDSWTITAEAFHSDGSAASATDTGISGSIDGSMADGKILDVKATIEPHSYVIYTIAAKTNPLANGHIQNSVTVDNSVYADRGSDPHDFEITLNKTVKTNTSGGFNSERVSYSKNDNEVTYQLHVKNKKGNGFATNVSIIDEISKIEAGVLEPDNESKKVFTSWTISAEIVSDNALLNGNDTYTKVGDFEDNKDLNVTAQIPPDVEIIYTIVGQMDRSDGDRILYKRFDNTVTVKTPDSDSQESTSDTAVVYPKEPDVVVVKTTQENEFFPGQWVTFDVTVYNRGAGYANEVSVKDDIKAMNAFSKWEISSSTDRNNSPYKTGSYAGSPANYADNNNIDTKVDIDPQTKQGMGFVRYTIRGLVRSDYEKYEISNTAEIHDPINNLDQSASAEIGDSGDEKLNVSIVKSADKRRFIPGEDVTYLITLANLSENKADRLKLVDPLTQIKSVLANQKDDHFANYRDQSPFEYWQFDYADGAGWRGKVTDDLVYPEGDENTTFSLAAGETRTFKIKARIKDNVIGSDNEGFLEPIIANDAYIFRDYKQVTEASHVSHHEMERVASGGGVTRELLVNGSPSRYYAPGDTLTYKVTLSAQNGYMNDHVVDENIKGVSVQLLDGTSANPFNDTFSVDVGKEDSDGGNGTTTGEQDGVVADNENIDTTIDVAGGDSVWYTVEGVVRDDAVGDITIGGITVEPYEYHLTFTKTVDQKNYQPGENLTYRLTVKNDGKGSAYYIPIEDELSTIEVELIDTTQGKAFPSGWKIEPKVLGGSKVAEVDLDGTLADNRDINTHISVPAGETIQYVVTAPVNQNAVGDILNLLRVDNDTVSAESKTDTEKYVFEKRVLKYYDQDGKTELVGGYTPGGYIEYQILLENKNNVHLQDVKIVDKIGEISTRYYDDTTGQAFDSWTIKTEVDDSGLSHAGVTADNDDIDTEFDIAGSKFAKGGTFVRYVIKAKVSEKAVGSIQNIARVDDSHNLPSERSDMLAADLKKTHKAYTDTSFNTQKTNYNFDSRDKGQEVVYHLRIENKGKGTEFLASLKEEFSKVKSRLAQNAAGEPNDQKGFVFEQYGWTVTATTSGELVTDIGGYAGGSNVDINIPKLSIAPGGWIDFVIEGKIRDDALENVIVKPNYNGSSFQKSTIKPDAQNLLVSKQILSIGGRAYRDGDTYKPGEEVIYLLDVDNAAKVWTDQTRIRDIVSDIQVEVIGGATEQAFDSFAITHTISQGLELRVDTYLPDYDANSDIDPITDIGPAEDIQFTIKGTIREDALGEIDANKAVGGSTTVVTPTIPPIAPKIDFEKLVVNTTADSSSCTFPSNSGSGCEYNPSGQVNYTITVENNGEGIANDVSIVDELNKISTSTGTKAFSNLSSTILEKPSSDRFAISGSYEGNKPLNATFDLMPGDKVVFGLSGVVDADATGTITNIAKVDGTDSNDIVLGQGQAEVLASKSTDTPTYVPGGEVRYTMYVANKSDSNVDVRVQDQISNFTVETADGTQKTALKDWTTSVKFVGNAGAAHNDASAIQTKGDIDAIVKLGAASTEPTVLQINVVGHVRDDAIGKFGNTLYVDTKQYDLQQHFIYPEQGTLQVSKVASLSPALYAPGDSIGFDIEVENTGGGYVQNVVIEDLAKQIKADVVDSLLPQHAFDSWDASKSSVSVVDSSASKTQVISETAFDSSDGFKGNYNIAPNSKVVLHLEGTVRSNVIGEIENQVEVTADNQDALTARATYQPIDAEVTVSKTVDKDVYLAGDTLTYTIVLTNTQRVWAADVNVVDLIDRVSSTSISGSTVTAFDAGSYQITGVSSLGTTSLPALSGDYIDNTVDIAPNDTITVTIKATLKEDIVGEVKNTVTVDYDGKTVVDEAVSEPLVPKLSVTKQAIHPTYEPGKQNGFTITIENQDAAFANDITLQDVISSILVETTDGTEQLAFSRWLVDWRADDPRTQVQSSTYSWDTDINNVIDLAPNDTIVFTVEGPVEDKAIGQIENTALVKFDGKEYSPTAVIEPEKSTIKVEKVADREYYQAGQLAQFTITVTNDGNGFANDVELTDLMSDVMVTLVDGSKGKAFEQWVIETKYSDPRSSLVAEPTGNNPDIDTLADIAPNSNITFVIKGKVNSYATSDIYNQVSVTAPTEAPITADALIKHRPVSLKLEKFVGEAGSDTQMAYEPGKEATFRVVLSNQNEAFVAGIQLKDLLKSMQVTTVKGSTEKAFETWTIDVSKGSKLTSISPDPSGANKEVDATVNLAPNDTLELTIKGKVNEFANGQIDNKASMTTLSGRAQRYTAVASLLPEPDNVLITEVADNPIYIAGEQSTFRVTLFNDSKGFANDIVLSNMVSRMLVPTRPDISTGQRQVVRAFTDWIVDISSNDPRTKVIPGSIAANADIEAVMDIAPGDSVEFAITGTVDARAMGEIVNVANKIAEAKDNAQNGGRNAGGNTSNRSATALSNHATIETVSAMITPEAVRFAIDKTTSKGDNAQYTNEDDELVYLLKVSNEGAATISGVEMVDEISKLVGANGNALFTSWKVRIEEWPTGQLKGEFTDKDLMLPDGSLSLDLLPYMGNGYEITITGQLNKGLDDNVTNTFTVEDPSTGQTASDSVTIHVKKFADNEGQLSVTKAALQNDVSVGDVVEYEVIIQNNNDSEFKNVKLVDRYPAGFEYVEGSTEMTNSGPDGAFDTGDDVLSSADPSVTNEMVFNVGDILVYGNDDGTTTEQVRIRYLLRVSVGATFGKYVNTAVAMTPPEGQTSGALVVNSNKASAIVEVVPDKVFDTASIIGKVFEDHNQDGFQADATAYDVHIKVNMDEQDYIPGTTLITKEGAEIQLEDVPFKSDYHPSTTYGVELNTKGQYEHGYGEAKARLENQHDSVLAKGHTLDKLFGISSNRTLPHSNKIAYQLKTHSRAGFSFRIETNAGSYLEFDRDGKIKTNHSSDKAEGLSAENLDITRNLYKDGNDYLWEIVIENKGIYEDGIPGVRLLTTEGIVIETDQYGRFHVPDQWVLDKKGKNFLVKVDTDSLPTGMKVISENPKVQRISPNKLTKFNFSIHTGEED